MAYHPSSIPIDIKNENKNENYTRNKTTLHCIQCYDLNYHQNAFISKCTLCDSEHCSSCNYYQTCIPVSLDIFLCKQCSVKLESDYEKLFKSSS